MYICIKQTIVIVENKLLNQELIKKENVIKPFQAVYWLDKEGVVCLTIGFNNKETPMQFDYIMN